MRSKIKAFGKHLAQTFFCVVLLALAFAIGVRHLPAIGDWTPESAGCCSIGNLALPLANLYIGAAATNNIKITGTATASRTQTLPDLDTNIGAASGRQRYCSEAGGTGIALATAGTNTTLAAATTKTYISLIDIPRTVTLTGGSVLNGGTAGGTDKWVYALYTSAGGAAVRTTATAGTASSGTNAFQDIAWTSTYTAVGPARYWFGFQTNGTTDKIQTVAAANSWGDVLTQQPTSATFGTFPSLTPPTTFTADVGPIACVY